MSEICNAKITDTAITMGNYGCLTFLIGLESGALCVSYGGYCIGNGSLEAILSQRRMVVD